MHVRVTKIMLRNLSIVQVIVTLKTRYYAEIILKTSLDAQFDN